MYGIKIKRVKYIEFENMYENGESLKTPSLLLTTFFYVHFFSRKASSKIQMFFT